MTRFLVSFLLALAVFLPLGVWAGKSLQGSGAILNRPVPSPTAAPTPELVDMTGLNSPHAILLRRGGPVLGEVGADDPIYPASLTKMMTVLLAAETLTDLDAQVTMAEDLYPPLWEANASMAGFQPGETVTVRDLLYGALLPSGAECCSALARCGDSEYILVTAGAPGDNHSETLHLEDAVTVYTRLAASIAG